MGCVRAAVKLDDSIKSMSGKSIEVVANYLEGRLILVTTSVERLRAMVVIDAVTLMRA
jgi:leucyl aminopeptidase